MCVESFACAGEVRVRRWTTRGGTRFTFYDVYVYTYEVAHDLPCDLAWLEVRDNLPVYSRDRLVETGRVEKIPDPVSRERGTKPG